jgi:hypothetical protein
MSHQPPTGDSALTLWEHPRDYGGFSPDGDYILLARTRDSSALDRSNWTCICADLDALAYDDGDDGFADRPKVYHWRAGHWACGWVEYLMLRHDADQQTLDRAHEIACALESYPVFNEDHFSELEYTEAAEYWERMSVRERYDAIKFADCGASIFAARRAELPHDDSGSLFEYLRG